MRGKVLMAGLATLMIGLVNAAPAAADVRQIGGQSTDSSDGGRIGVRTTMTEPGPSQLYDGATQFYWSGLFFPDGGFYQVGYTQHYPGCSSNQWFVQAFDAAGNRTTAAAGLCGLTGTRQFTMNYRGIQDSRGLYIWSAYVGTDLLGGGNTYSAFNYSSSTRLPYTVSELAIDGGLPDARDTLPGVRYFPASQVRTNAGTWFDSGHAKVHRQNASCPPLNAFADGFNNMRAGSGYASTCQSTGVALW